MFHLLIRICERLTAYDIYPSPVLLQVFTPRSMRRYEVILANAYQSILNLSEEKSYSVIRQKEERIDVAEAQTQERDIRDEDLAMLIKMSQKNLPVIDIDRQLAEEAAAQMRKDHWALYPIAGFKEEKMEEEKALTLAFSILV